MFKVGDEVVCVDDSPWRSTGTKSLQKGKVYTIRDSDNLPPDHNGDIGFHLVEVETPFTQQNVGWSSFRFRKVQKRDLAAWLATENTVEGPVRKKVKA